VERDIDEDNAEPVLDEEKHDELEDLPDRKRHHPKSSKKKHHQYLRSDSHMSTASRDTIQSHKEPSMRFSKIKQRTPSIQKQHLEKPRVRSVGLQGYPGELTMEEIEECVSFYRIVHSPDIRLYF
jgi:hypothetical protein